MKRNHLTVARLRALRLHAIRISGHLHVTGVSIHGCLVVPTRAFWSALARMAELDEPEFGDEYAFFRRCLKRVGARRCDFTVTVHGEAQLLTDVRRAATSPARPDHFVESETDATTSAAAERRLPWDEILQDLLAERLPHPSSADEGEYEEPSWPLMEGYDPQSDSRRVWGWELRSLPRGKFHQLLSGPEGTLRPSRN